MECILYHLMWVVSEWLVKKLKIIEKLIRFRHHISRYSNIKELNLFEGFLSER